MSRQTTHRANALLLCTYIRGPLCSLYNYVRKCKDGVYFNIKIKTVLTSPDKVVHRIGETGKKNERIAQLSHTLIAQKTTYARKMPPCSTENARPMVTSCALFLADQVLGRLGVDYSRELVSVAQLVSVAIPIFNPPPRMYFFKPYVYNAFNSTQKSWSRYSLTPEFEYQHFIVYQSP